MAIREKVAVARKGKKTLKLFRQRFYENVEYTAEHSDIKNGEMVLNVRDDHGFSWYCLRLVKNGWTVDALNKHISKEIDLCKRIEARREVRWKQ
ncbi:hypothetical protein HB912_07200 [Listeria aquatica]|uniref:Uncharacterized protein n=1 Tax=Listeria aquatica TaxID=1494960 RepID=A0A841ZR33_9LIST|nr:hypothetical protein [Listeria aquatica]MBC1521430.1 hypothetical protein [Listeria aquatica]